MKYAVVTLGCKVNQFETQAMEALLQSHGHVPTSDGDADAVIVNTCAVTAESGRKSRQALRRLMHDNPGAVAAVCGCFSQIEPEEIAALGADVLFGSGDRVKFTAAVEAAVAERQKIRSVDDPFKRMEIERLPAGALEGRTRAYMKIEDGCDNFCTYCVIPYARGRVRSMPVAEAAAEAARLQAEGFREIIVTGIEISSYGKDLRDGSNLGSVLAAIGMAAPETRIRIGSIEPTVITEDFCKKLSAAGTVCPHFHLSLQSGCDVTLKNMNRKYTTAEFAEIIARLRKFFPNCALTTDIIAGFPGETEKHHTQTLEFLENCAFADIHVFPYSRRPGTKADKMPNHLDRATKARRAKDIRILAEKSHRAYLEAAIGKTLPVLFETEENGLWQGHSDTYIEVLSKGDSLRGLVKNVKITGIRGDKLVGEIN